MRRDRGIAVIHGGKTLVGTVDVSGSKHSALHILGAALLADGDVVIDNFPVIDDALNFLRIYESMGVAGRVTGRTAVLSVIPEKIRFDQSRLNLVERLRSSVLLLGSLLLRNHYVRMPIPGGDKIDPNGQRSIDEFLKVLDMFGIGHNLRHDRLEARLDRDLVGDKNIDLGRKDLFGFRTGNSRTALAMILAAGNRGRTIIRSALRAAEILQLGEFLLLLGYEVQGLGTETLEIRGEGLKTVAHTRTVNVALYPDKCEIAFWIVAACLTHGDLVLRLPKEFSGYSVNDLGPLYRINEAILSRMNIPIKKISQCEYRVAAGNAHFRGIDLILDHLETEFNGKVMDASPYFIPLMCVAEGNSRYLDSKFGRTRVAFGRELNKLGARIRVVADGMAHITGGRKLRGDRIWCEAVDIRGAGALLLSMLAIEGENRLVGVEFLNRANDYIPKLTQLGCDIRYAQAGGKDELVLGKKCRVNKISVLRSGSYGVDYEERAPVVFRNSCSVAEAVFSSFLHPNLQGTGELESLLEGLDGNSLLSVDVLPKTSERVDVLIRMKTGETMRRNLRRNPSHHKAASDLEEYVGVIVDGHRYFAGRCLSPVGFAEWETRITEILASPGKIWMPITVTVGITDRCNYRCEFCFAAGRKRRDDLSGNALLKLIGQLADCGVKAVRFVGGGEATIHPNFVEALLLARARGLGTFLITNGSTLQLNPSIFATCVDSLRVSINCAGAGAYSRMHGVAGPVFDSVLKGIRRVRGFAPRNRVENRPLIGASYVLTGANSAGMIGFARLLKEAGVDYVLFKKAHGAELSAEQRESVAQNLKCIIDELEDDIFKVVPEMFVYEFPDLDARYYGGPAGCLLTQLRAVIEPNGDVLTCNQKGLGYFARIGNIHDSSFLEIMNGEARRTAMDRRRRRGEVCPDCLFEDAHLLFSKLLKTPIHSDPEIV